MGYSIIWTLILSSFISLYPSRRVAVRCNHSVTANAQEVQEGTGVGNASNAGPSGSN